MLTVRGSCSDNILTCLALVSLSIPANDAVLKKCNRFNILQEILGDCGRAAIQTQGSTSNPFRSTFVYGYPNVAFEVNPSNSY